MTLTVQFYTLICMIAMGISLGMAVDSYQILFRIHLTKQWIKAVNDLMFWLLFSILFFVTLFLINEGTLRFYIFLALLCGYATYRALLETVYTHFLIKLIRIVKTVYKIFIKALKKVIIQPVQWIIISVYRLFKAVIQMFYNFILNFLLWILRLFKGFVMWILHILWMLTPKPLKKLLKKAYHQMIILRSRWINMKSKLVRKARIIKNALKIKK